MDKVIQESDFLLYWGEDGRTHAQVILGDETVWVSSKTMSQIFDCSVDNIYSHLKNVFSNAELNANSVSEDFSATAADGKTYKTKFYNLEAIIAVGYRVNSYKATKFRQWATRVLKEYLIKGFALDDERLKQGNRLFGKDYFKELLERIREIRTSEKMFYEKVAELYATSVDYDKDDPLTHNFFRKVQAKLEFAVVGKTPSEIIKSRADHKRPNMGLTTWKNVNKEGKILLSDVTTAKNYLSKDELTNLNLLVSAFLDHAEMIASRNRIMKMEDWSQRLDKFLEFNEYKVLGNAGKVRKEVADAFAEHEFSKFRVIQDRNSETDFTKWTKQIKTTGQLPTEAQLFNPASIQTPKDELSSFNQKLLTALNHQPNKTNKTGAKRGPKPKTKECPRCGKVLPFKAKFCDGTIELEDEVVNCGYIFE